MNTPRVFAFLPGSFRTGFLIIEFGNCVLQSELITPMVRSLDPGNRNHKAT